MKKCNKLLLISFFVLGMAMQPAVLCAQKKSDSPIVEVGFDKKRHAIRVQCAKAIFP